MPAEGHKTITVTDEVEGALKKLWKEDKLRPSSQSVSDYVEGILNVHLEQQKLLAQYGPFLEYQGPGDNNRLSLFDSFIGNSVTVWIDSKEKKLKCGFHKMRDDCIHVGFCFGLREVYKVLIERGFRPPKHII